MIIVIVIVIYIIILIQTYDYIIIILIVMLTTRFCPQPKLHRRELQRLHTVEL